MMISIVRNAVAAAGVAFAVAFASTMDANPSLYLFDKFVVNEKKRHSYFRGKTIWITGASSGIGAELARQASRYGVRNLILTGRSAERLQAVADGCIGEAQAKINEEPSAENDMATSSTATTVSILPLDMTASESEFQTAVDTLEKMLGGEKLDCVVLNAGLGQLQTAVKTPSSTTSELFQVNTLAPIAISQLLLERGILSEQKAKQHIVVTSSIGALMGVPLSASYAGSKWAIQGYMQSLKAEMPWLSIDLICPGPIDTSFFDKQPKGKGDSENPRESETTIADATKEGRRRLKMPVERCVRLYLSSLVLGESNDGGEYWIAEQPTLSGLYINQYFPAIFQKLLTKVGPFRVQAWEEGKDLYDPETWKTMGKTKKKK